MRYFKNLVKPYIVWSFLMIVVPLLLIVLYSLTTGGNSLVNIQFTLDNFMKIAEPIYLSVFVRSFKIGLITVIICFLMGYPLAYMISKKVKPATALNSLHSGLILRIRLFLI